MKHFLLSVLIVLSFSSYSQQWSQMNDSLLRGGFVVSGAHQGIFANDSVIILATASGIYRSEDYGTDWAQCNAGINKILIGVCAIANLDNDPYLLVDYKDVYSSVDNGVNWTITTLNGIPSSAFGSMDQLFSVKGALYLTASGSRYKSTDGSNWIACGNVQPIGSDSLSWVMSSGQAALENSSGVIRLLPNIIGGAAPSSSLVMSPSGQDVYCFTGTNIYRYDLSGTDTAWTLTSPFPTAIPAYTGFSPTYSHTFGATDSAVFLSIVGEGLPGKRFTKLYRSTDRAVTWTDLTGAGLEVPVMIALKQVGSGFVIMNDITGNILFSFDRGVQWQKRNSHFITHYQQNLIVMDNSLLLKQVKNMSHRSVPGILQSDDNGATWHYSNAGLPLVADFEYDSAKIYGNFDFLFKTGNIAYCGRQPTYLAKSYDEGDTWSSVTLPPVPGDMVLWYQGDQNTFFVVMAQGGLLSYFRTNDEGNTWQIVPSIDTIASYAPLQIFGKNDTLLMFLEGGGIIPGLPRHYIYRSYDNGTAWTDISGSTFLNSVLAVDWVNGGGYAIPLIDFDSITDRFMAVLTSHDVTSYTSYHTGPTYDSIYYYDSGSGWTHVNASGLPSGINITALHFDDGSWNIASDSGMYVSSDGGLTWTNGVSAFAPSNESRTLSNDGFHEGMSIATLNIRNTNAFVSTALNGCWTNTSLTGISEHVKEDVDLIVYPNPSNGEIHLLSKKSLSKCNIQIFDISGKLLKSLFLDAVEAGTVVEFNIAMLKSGIYIVKFQSDQSIFQEKLIIINN